MNRLSIAPLAFALVAFAAPAARAQVRGNTTTNVTVCNDGVTVADVTSRACVRHNGINVEATRQLRAQRTNNTGYGVYDNRGNVTNGNQIPCGDGTYSATGIHGCDARGGVSSTTATLRCTDGTLTTGGIHACAAHGGVSTNQSNIQNNGTYNNGTYNNGRKDNDNDDDRNNNGQYNSNSRSGRPSAKNATAKCVDGTYSKANSRRGACVQHGGIATWYGKRK